MTDTAFCKQLSGESCSVVGERCFRIEAGARCEYIGYYERLTAGDKDTPAIATRARANMIAPLLARWKNYLQHPRPGAKNVVASPLEGEVIATIESELEPVDVTVYARKRYRIWGDIAIIADGLVEKQGFPTSVISVKTWLGPGQVRETFAYAYWAKTWLGQKHIRVYQVAILRVLPRDSAAQGIIEICKPYLDGAFFLTEAPYIDDLIGELKETYSEPQT